MFIIFQYQLGMFYFGTRSFNVNERFFLTNDVGFSNHYPTKTVSCNYRNNVTENK